MGEEYFDDEPMAPPICEICRRLDSARTIMNAQGSNMINVCQYCYWRNQADVRLHTMRQSLISASLARMAIYSVVDALSRDLIVPEMIDVDPFHNIALWAISAEQAREIRECLKPFGEVNAIWTKVADNSNRITGEFRHEFQLPSRIETEEGLFKGDIRIVKVDCKGGDL